LEVDGAEGAVHPEVGRAVDQVVLAAELLFDVRKPMATSSSLTG